MANKKFSVKIDKITFYKLCGYKKEYPITDIELIKPAQNGYSFKITYWK